MAKCGLDPTTTCSEQLKLRTVISLFGQVGEGCQPVFCTLTLTFIETQPSNIYACQR